MAKELKRRIVAEFSAKNRAKGVMAGFRRDMDTTGRALRRMAVGALAVAGIGGMGYMLKKTMESVDQIAKMSDELRISTEALTGLEHAAKISGTSIESLHKGIGIFVRRMGEAKYGVGEGVRGLKMLNLTAEEMIKMGTEKSFMLIAERISQAGSAAEQAGIAYNFFGRQGTQLLNMFQQGREGIEAMREEAERLGLTFSRFDAAKVEAANDALTRARAVLTGLFRQATIQMAPYIEALADKFVDVSTAGEGMGAKVVNVFELISLAAIRFGGLIQTIPAYWKGVEAGAREALANIYDVAAAATNLDILFKKLKRPGWEKTYKELAEEQRQLAEALKEAGGRELAGVYGQENAVKRFYDNLRKQAAEWQKVYEKRAKQLTDTTTTGFRELTDAEKKASKELDQYIDKFQRGTITTEEWLKQEEEAYHAMRASIIEAEEAARESAERRIKLADELQERHTRISEEYAMATANAWTDAFMKMATEGKEFGDAMEDMLRELLAMIMRIYMYRKIAEPMAKALFNIPITGTAALSGGFPTTAHGVPYIPAGGGPGGLQYGGIVERTGWAKVHKGETFSGVGGAPIRVEIHNEGSEKLQVREAEFDLRQQVLNITMQAAGTDGPYRRAHKQIR